ncbi:MAG: hypothetical protein AB1831_10675 [Pseudomonadota bacterium]
MWLFWITLLAVAVYWFWLRKKPRLAQSYPPLPKVTLKSESSQDEFKIRYVPTGSGGFVIGPDWSIPMTLFGLDEADISRLVTALEQQKDYELWEWFTHVVARNNVQCKELQAWIMDSKPKIEAEVARLMASSKDWAEASDLDKEDLLVDMRHEALSTLQVRPADLEATWTLLFDEPRDLSVDDDLLEKFKATPETYQLLLRVIDSGYKVQVVPMTDYRRKAFDELYAKGFMLRGKEIALEDILMSMTMKQMQEIAGQDAPKKFTRKAQAVDFLKTLPDIWNRLEKTVAFRELFQIKPMTEVDVDELAKAYAYAGAVARVVLRTLQTAVKHERLKRSVLLNAMSGWRLDSENCCPVCQAKHGTTWTKLPEKLPPYHIGCEARVHLG